MVEAAIEIGGRFESALAAELGESTRAKLRAGLEHIVERSGAAADLAARRVRSM